MAPTDNETANAKSEDRMKFNVKTANAAVGFAVSYSKDLVIIIDESYVKQQMFNVHETALYLKHFLGLC